MNESKGILLIAKPKGMTSQDVLTTLKKTLQLTKIGHTGTLDPLATGLLVTLIGSSTKLAPYLNGDKEYECEILIGRKSDTDDITGKIIEVKKVNQIENVDAVLASFLGKSMQMPPMYSSIKYQGKKLYEIARKGMEVPRSPREIDVKEIRRISPLIYENATCTFSFVAKVSKGTYLRSLCLDIGKMLGYPSLMLNLKRTKVGAFALKDAFSIEDIKSGKYKLLEALDCIPQETQYEIKADILKNVLNGKRLRLDCGLDRVFLTFKKELIGVYEKDGNEYRAKRIWKQSDLI